MTRTAPIPAGQPPDATRTRSRANRHAGRRPGGGRAGGSLRHAGRTAVAADPRSPRSRRPGQRAGPAAPATPAPGAAGRGDAGSGGAGRAATIPSGPPGAVRAGGAITLGVEEEFLLLDPSTGATVLAAPELMRMLGGEPGVRQELMPFQVETATWVCTSLDEVGRELVRLRRLAAAAAASLGCRLRASGVAPYRTPGLAAITGQPRYRELARRYAPVVAEAGTCACHVHIGVPSRDLGVQVLVRLRPWLAPLLAVTANSPIALRAPYRMGQLAVCDPVTLADRRAARGVAGRRRLRHGGPPLHRPGRGAGRAQRLLPGPAVPALSHRRGPGRRRPPGRWAPRCCWRG